MLGSRYLLGFADYTNKQLVSDYAVAASTKGVMPCVDVDNSALQFWIYPYANRNEWYIGLTCWGKDTDAAGYIDGISAIYVNLADYADLSRLNAWQQVTIPLKDIKENGIFDLYSDTMMTSFDWYRVCGMYIRVSTENYSVGNVYNLAAFDDVKIISYLQSPKNLEITQNSNSARLVWDEQKTAAGYIVYKDDVEDARLPENTPYYECGMGSYKIQAYDADGRRSRAVAAEIDELSDAYTDVNDLTVKNVFYKVNGNDTTIIWDKTDDAEGYFIYRDDVMLAKTTGTSYTDNSTGSEYSVRAYAGNSLSNGFSALESTQKSQITGIGYIGFDGSEYESISDADRIKSIKIDINNFGAGKNSELICAIYNNQRLVEVKKVNVYIKSGKSEQIINSEIFACNLDNCIFKVILLEDFQHMEPLMSSSERVEDIPQKERYSISINSENYQELKGWGLELAMPGAMPGGELQKWGPFKEAMYKNLGITITRAFLDCELYIDGKMYDSAVPNGQLVAIIEENDKNGVPFDGSIYQANIVPIENIENAVRQGTFDKATVKNTADLIKMSCDNGIRDYIISVTSPPKVMLDCFDPGGGNNPRFHLRADCVDAFTDLIIQELDYITKICGNEAPNALSLQNEPENGWVTPQYSYTEYKNTLISLKRKLIENGYNDIKLIGPESSHYGALWVSTGKYDGESRQFKAFSEIDDEFMQALDILACHSYYMPETDAYGNENHEETERRFREFADFTAKEKWQTEFCPGYAVKTGPDYEIRTAIHVMNILCSDIGWAGNSVWFYWLGYYHLYVPLKEGTVEVSWGPDKDGNLPANTQTLGFGALGAEEFHENKVYDALSMLFNNVTPGYVVKRAQTNCPTLKNANESLSDIAAFEKDNSTCVLIVNDSDNNYSFDFDGLKGTKATVYAVMNNISGVQSISDMVVNNGSVGAVRIPKKSIVLLKTE